MFLQNRICIRTLYSQTSIYVDEKRKKGPCWYGLKKYFFMKWAEEEAGERTIKISMNINDNTLYDELPFSSVVADITNK